MNQRKAQTSSVNIYITIAHLTLLHVLCSIDRASRHNRVKKNQLDAQLILSILRQPPRVSGVPRPIFRRYSRMCTKIGIYYSF
jgi:hypothetical protein